MTIERPVSAYDAGSTRVIVVSGEIDVLYVDVLRDVFDEAIQRAPAELVVDLADLAFIESMGLGVLITSYRRAERSGITVRLARPSPFVRKLLQGMGMLPHFRVDEDWRPASG
ncbi:STAS domain-containing protein [Dactylosporangium sp. NPDC049525]|uniref:STAS domain-containing protein n=1 Tax=Dactylosporangium sp. NPDC049525 TaxID=3154730 RepID=UPI00343A7167